jgi:hypothetical protein
MNQRGWESLGLSKIRKNGVVGYKRVSAKGEGRRKKWGLEERIEKSGMGEKSQRARRHTCPVFTVVFIDGNDAAEGYKLDEIGHGVEGHVSHHATNTRQVSRRAIVMAGIG